MDWPRYAHLYNLAIAEATRLPAISQLCLYDCSFYASQTNVFGVAWSLETLRMLTLEQVHPVRLMTSNLIDSYTRLQLASLSLRDACPGRRPYHEETKHQ